MNFSSRQILTGDNGGYSYTSDELNSKMSLNGIEITRDSNVVADLISGVSIQLKQAMQEGVPTVNITVKNNMEAIKADISSFIEKFNEAYKYAKDNSKTQDGKRGVFVGNASATGLTQSFANIVYSKVEGLAEGNFSSLSEIGIEFNSQTGLKIADNADLEAALSNNPKQVSELFGSTNGVATKLYDIVNKYNGADGIITDMTASYDKSVSYYTDKITFKGTQIDKSADLLRNQYERMQTQLSALYNMQSQFQMAGILS